MVRIRRDPHEPTDVGRPFYFCVGKVPVVGTPVWAMGNHATGFVFGDFVDPEDIPVPRYQQVQDSSTARPQRDALNFGQAILATDNPATQSTDISLQPSSQLATPGVDGFMPGVDKTKLNTVETGATGDQTNTEVMALVKSVDGSGSALDADMVDGEHAGAFSQTGHTHGEYSTTAHTHATYYQRVRDNSVDQAQRPSLNFSTALGIQDNAASNHSSVYLKPEEQLATTSSDGFLSGADKVRINNASQIGHTHGFPAPEREIPVTSLVSGGTHQWTHSYGFWPRFIFCQIRNPGAAQWSISAQGIGFGVGSPRLQLAVDTEYFWIYNDYSTTVEYRAYAFG